MLRREFEGVIDDLTGGGVILPPVLFCMDGWVVALRLLGRDGRVRESAEAERSNFKTEGTN